MSLKTSRRKGLASKKKSRQKASRFLSSPSDVTMFNVEYTPYPALKGLMQVCRGKKYNSSTIIVADLEDVQISMKKSKTHSIIFKFFPPVKRKYKYKISVHNYSIDVNTSVMT